MEPKTLCVLDQMFYNWAVPSTLILLWGFLECSGTYMCIGGGDMSMYRVYMYMPMNVKARGQPRLHSTGAIHFFSHWKTGAQEVD